jgi:hypothetical protein
VEVVVGVDDHELSEGSLVEVMGLEETTVGEMWSASEMALPSMVRFGDVG